MILLYNFFTKNPIAEMYGPYFLFLFILFTILVYSIGYYYKTKIENTPSDSIINIGNLPEPDPYLIAYVRSGVGDTAKIIVYNLFVRGYLTTNDGKRKYIIQHPNHPPINNLLPIEKKFFDLAKEATRVEEVVDDIESLKELNVICLESIKSTHYNELMFSEQVSKKLDALYYKMATAIVLFGLYKIIVAMINGHTNVLFLIGLMVLGVKLLSFILKPSRITLEGKTYIKNLKSIYKSKYFNKLGGALPHYKVLVAAIFGTNILVELGFSFLVYYTTIKHITYDSGGTCGTVSCSGSSCGGDGGGSGGCGGGCGGCGGGD